MPPLMPDPEDEQQSGFDLSGVVKPPSASPAPASGFDLSAVVQPAPSRSFGEHAKDFAGGLVDVGKGVVQFAAKAAEHGPLGPFYVGFETGQRLGDAGKELVTGHPKEAAYTALETVGIPAHDLEQALRDERYGRAAGLAVGTAGAFVLGGKGIKALKARRIGAPEAAPPPLAARAAESGAPLPGGAPIAPAAAAVGGVSEAPALAPAGTPAPATTTAPAATFPKPPVLKARAIGEPIADPMKGMDPFLTRFPEPVRAGVRDVIERNGGFAEQRGGVQTHELTEGLARELAADVDRAHKLEPGTAMNAPQLRAYANAAATVQSKINSLAEKVTRGAATDADVLGLETARAEHRVLVESLVGARAEAGRALASFRMLANVLDSQDPALIRTALDAAGTRTAAQQLASDLATLPADPLARYAFLKQQGKPGLLDRFRQVYYSSILSGLKTHERNILGNSANVLTNLAVQPVAAGVDLVRSRATGNPREVFFGELPHEAVAVLAGVPRAFREFTFALKHGVSRASLERTVTKAAEGSKFDLPRVEMPGGALNPFNIPGRALEAADVFFRTLSRNQELAGASYALAKQEAMQRGLRGAQRADYIQDRMADLRYGDSPEAIKIQEQADAYATRSVFQEQAGPFTSWLMKGQRAFPPLMFVTPFLRTPGNIMRQGFEFSPAGAVMKGARAGGRIGAQAQARVALGSALVAPLAWLAATGRLSGSGPRDPAERAALMEAGWRPNSVKVQLSPEGAAALSKVTGLSQAPDGEYWVSYTLFQPVSVPASVVANAYESWRDNGASAKDATAVATTTVFRTLKSTLQQSYLSGLFDFLEAIDNPEQRATQVASRTATGLIPFSGLLRNVAQAADPIVRQPEGVAEGIAVSVPGASHTVPARLDRFGEDVTRPGSALTRLTDALNVSPATADPVARELERLGVRLSLPSGRLTTEQPLSREQTHALKQASGRAVRSLLVEALEDPGYALLTDAEKRELLEDLITKARRQVNTKARQAVKAGGGIGPEGQQ